MSNPLREGADMADAAFGLRAYGARYWAVYEGDVLICVTVYKRGAKSVIERLTRPSMASADRAAIEFSARSDRSNPTNFVARKERSA
jgi:hypothetical protein